MNLLLAALSATNVDPPAGTFSQASWAIIVVLGATLMAVSGFAVKWLTKMYDDLKACNAARAAQEEDILGLLKVLRLQMEQSRGGRPR